jgi:hypothetical protein
MKVGTVVEVTVTLWKTRSSFTCPECAKKVTYPDEFPIGFSSKVCSSCGVEWLRVYMDGTGPHRKHDQLEPGATLRVLVMRGGVWGRALNA